LVDWEEEVGWAIVGHFPLLGIAEELELWVRPCLKGLWWWWPLCDLDGDGVAVAEAVERLEVWVWPCLADLLW
jgi:hypothetical protein